MKDLIQYQIEVVICMAAIALLYLLLWRKETNFLFKRFLLVSIPLFALTIPLISLDFNLQPEQDLATIQYITYLPNQLELVYAPITAKTESITGWEIAFWIFAMGAIIMLFRLIISYYKIWQLYHQSDPDTSGEFRLMDDHFQSFSFFTLVMINRSQALSSERDYILAHEKAHSRQGHSYDVLWLELVKMLHWFNPIIWLIAHESKQNMEYLADHEVTQTGSNLQNYQYAIVHHASNSGYRLLKTQFSKSNLKNRIIMMNQPNNHKVATWKILVILPAFAILFMSFSLNFENLDIPINLKEKFLDFDSSITDYEISESLIGTRISDNESGQSSPKIDSFEKQIQSVGPIATSAPDKIVNNNPKIKINQDSGRNSTKKIDAFQIQSLNANVWELNAYNLAVLSGKAKVISPPPQRNLFGSKLRVSYGINFRAENQINGTIRNESGYPVSGVNILIKGFTTGTITDLKGQFQLKFEPEHKQIVISKVGYEIKTLDIVADKNYEITLESDPSTPPPPPNVTNQSEGIAIRANGENIIDPNKKPLFIVDGVEIENFDESTINPENIESISILKDTTAAKKYGQKAKHGVIIIKSKANSYEKSPYIQNKVGIETENILISALDKLPEYKEGSDAFYSAIQKQIKYPLEARENSIQGKTFVSFTITKGGEIMHIEADEKKYNLLKEIVVVGYSVQGNKQNSKSDDISILEEEVIRVIKLLDEFTPGSKDGEPVDVRMTLPVTFKLD